MTRDEYATNPEARKEYNRATYRRLAANPGRLSTRKVNQRASYNKAKAAM
jgi:hypothetical protein